jgi:hypothetical protein
MPSMGTLSVSIATIEKIYVIGGVLRKYMSLHTTYPLHLTIVRTYTLITLGVTQRSHDPRIIQTRIMNI